MCISVMNDGHNHMELRHLEHFVAVAEERSFTRAAARLHLVQSALSVSVRALEKELGGRLFDRTTHRVELTDAGQALLTEARITLASAEAARDAVAAVHGGLRGTVRVGIMQALSLIDLPCLLTEYNRARPEVQLVLSGMHGGSADLTRDVLEGRLDLAFAALPGGYPAGLSVRHLASEDMMLACPPDHPFAERDEVALEELTGKRFVDAPAGWGTRQSVDKLFVESSIQREVAVEVADILTVIKLVGAGFGFAFLSPSTVPESRKRELRRVRPSPPFTVSLITSKERRPSAATRALIDLVLERFPPAASHPAEQSDARRGAPGH
jgi:DNA-binding transcriptional LysR family regulator